MNKKTLYLFWAMLFGASFLCAQPVVNLSDSLNLVDLYRQLGGSNWSYQWDLSKPVGTWKGIGLDITGEYVETIDLDGVDDDNLTGINEDSHPGIGMVGRLDAILPSLDPFTRLQRLSFFGNSGLIGPFIGLVAPNLAELGLSNTQITSMEPSLNFPKLKKLIAAYCRLSGNLPNLVKICPDVEQINFEGNEMGGPLDILEQLTKLNTTLSLRRNNFDARFPPNVAQVLDAVFLTNNQFTFEDLIDAKNAFQGLSLSLFEYHEQDSVGTSKTFYAAVGHPYTLDIAVDTSLKPPRNCTYTWYKQGQSTPDSITSDSKLTFSAIRPADEGLYWCHITHPDMPTLVLKSRPINLRPCIPEQERLNPLLCPGEVFRLRGETYDERRRTGTQIVRGAVNGICDSVYTIELRYREILTPAFATCSDTSFLLQVNNPDNAPGQWTVSTGASIENRTAAQTRVSQLKDGPNVFTWAQNAPVCANSVSRSVTIQFDRPPVANPDIYTLIAGKSLSDSVLTTNDLVHNEDILEFLSQPIHGELEIKEKAKIEYTPEDNFFGLDSFTYQLCSAQCPDICSITTVFLHTILEETLAIITPNNDEYNNVLLIKELVNDPLSFQNNNLLIVNAWGSKVFETRNYQNDWRGTNYEGQVLPEATYYYYLYNSVGKPIYGRVAILR